MDKAPSGPSDSKLVSAVSGKVPNHKHIASKNANEYKSFKYIEDYKKAKNNLINIKNKLSSSSSSSSSSNSSSNSSSKSNNKKTPAKAERKTNVITRKKVKYKSI